MARFHRRAAALSLAVVLVLGLLSGVVGHRVVADSVAPTDNSATAAPFGTHWSFGVKFVCGRQQPVTTQGEPPVKPGNYATEVNIHNFNYTVPNTTTTAITVYKKVIVLVGTTAAGASILMREPNVAKPGPFARVVLDADTATMDDCPALLALSGIPLNPSTLTIGYLVILSPLDLDVDAVYTAAVPGVAGSTATGIAESVVKIPGKRLP
jgi:hypothetical protein